MCLIISCVCISCGFCMSRPRDSAHVRGCQILPHGAPLRPERKCASFGGLWRLWFGLKCAPAPSRADVLAAESWITPAKSMSLVSLAVPRKRPFTSNFDNRDIRLLPAKHRSTWGGAFPVFFCMVGFRDSTREIPEHHADVCDHQRITPDDDGISMPIPCEKPMAGQSLMGLFERRIDHHRQRSE